MPGFSPRPGFPRRRHGVGVALALFAGTAMLAASPVPLQAQSTRVAESAVQSGYAEADGARLHYQVFGDLTSGKTPLIVLHGSFMSGDAMKMLVEPLAKTRPVIATDARGHGRSGGVDGPMTYDRLADDGIAVLDALGVKQADVFGYSMGATTAIAMAVRHPERIGKQVVLSGPSSLEGWYPEMLASFAKLNPAIFVGSPIEREYKRLSPTPDKFATLVEKTVALEAKPYGYTDAAVRAIPGKTLLIVGDADSVTLDHAIALFRLRGGGDRDAATRGFIDKAPQARLAILPATSHIGVLAEATAIAAMTDAFLDDRIAPMPPGFF